jgi:hypothetical protein
VLRADLTDDQALRAVGMAIWAVWNVPDREGRVRVAREVRDVLMRGMLAHPAG